MGRILFYVWDVLKEQNIEIPFPQRDLHVKSLPSADSIAAMAQAWGQSISARRHGDDARSDEDASTPDDESARPDDAGGSET
jgi:hypothetical protein